tara:strand:- start:196 stop:495 length:300 start_codon:yes stop_codon:yes gene_type:complete
MDPLLLQYGALGLAAGIAFKGADLLKDIVSMKMTNGNGVSTKTPPNGYNFSGMYNDQNARVVYDVSKTMSEVVVETRAVKEAVEGLRSDMREVVRGLDK